VGRRKFTPEFKLEAVKLVRERGVTVRQAAADLGLHENVLRKWVKDAREHGAQAFPGMVGCGRTTRRSRGCVASWRRPRPNATF
jgi:transposase